MNLHVLLSFLTFFFVCPSIAQLSSGLVGYFDLDANADDQSPLSMNGVMYNLSPSTGINGTPSTCLNFNGTSSYISCGTDNRNITNDLTVSCWVKSTSTAAQIIVGKYDDNLDKGYICALNATGPRLDVRNTGGSYFNCISSTPINDGQWHHIVYVIDGSELRIYVDCGLVESLETGTSNPNVTSGDDLAIGRHGGSSTFYLDGDLDEVRIYNRVLDSLELDTLCMERTLSLDENPSSVEGFILFPNPAQNELTLEFSTTKSDQINIQIKSALGQTVHKESIHSKLGVNQNSLSIEGLEPGVYVLQIESNGQIITEKFVKQ